MAFDTPDVQTQAPDISMLGQGPTPPGAVDIEAPQAAAPVSSPGSFSTRFAAALKQPANGQPLSVGATLLQAGVEAMHQPSVLDAALRQNPSAVQAPKTPGAGFVDRLTGTLSDISHATDRPGGALMGAANVMAAREARGERAKAQATEQQKADATIAYNHALTAQLVHSMHRQDKEDRDASYAQGKAFVDSQRVQHDTEDNIPLDDLQKRVNDSPDYLRTHYATATGELHVLDGNGKQVIDDKGNPVFKPVFSLTSRQSNGRGQNIPVSDEQSKYFAKAGIEIPAGTSSLTIDDYKLLQNRAQIINEGTASVEKFNDQEMDEAKKRQIRSDVEKNITAISAYPDDPLRGLSEAAKNSDFHIKNLNGEIAALQKQQQTPDIQQRIAKDQDDLKQHQVERDSINNLIVNGFSDAAKDRHATLEEKRAFHEEEQQRKRDEDAEKYKDRMSDINVAMTDDMKKQIAALPDDKRAVLQQSPKEAQAALLSAAFGPGDLDFDRIFPPRLTMGAPGMTAQQAVGVIKQLNPNWDEQQFKQTAKSYKDITTGQSGRDIGMYNNVLEHAEEANDVMMAEQGRLPKVWNTPANKLAGIIGSESLSRIQSALLPIKEEYALLMSAGYKPGEEEMKAYNTLISDAATPGQISAALKVMAAVGAVRLGNINQQYKRVSGKNIPGILTTDSMSAAKRLNLDSLTMARLNSLDVGGNLFHNPNYKPPTPEEAQAQEQQKQSTIDAARAAREAANSIQHHTAAPVGSIPVIVDGKIVGYKLHPNDTTMLPIQL